MITLDTEWLGEPAGSGEMEKALEEAALAAGILESGEGPGGEFTGWVDLPERISGTCLGEMESLAAEIRSSADALVVTGIGGSYLGTRAVLEALGSDFPVYFAGRDLSPESLGELLDTLRDKRFYVNYISKSGGTLEPALAFRFLKKLLQEQVGDNWRSRVVATTDKSRGKLRNMAQREGLRSFPVPESVGGRYSVITAVGLFPLAVAGVDIRALVEGARAMRKICRQPDSPALRYAALRTLLKDRGRTIEVLAVYDPSLEALTGWWKQLFGESEGKDRQGLFPASVTFTTDLHSLGQWIQEGPEVLLETVLEIGSADRDLSVPAEENDDDGLGFLEGKSLDWINRMACRGTLDAHRDGGTPGIKLSIARKDAFSLGGLLYFFMYACGVSGYMQGVNPFDQPGVEAYKKNVFSLLREDGGK